MIKRKSSREIDKMREAGRIAAEARNLARDLVQVGATTKSIDKAIKNYILSQDAKPAFLGYKDYPASSCISINDEVIHGIPAARRLISGDIVSIDIGVKKRGYIGDCAATFVAGEPSEDAKRLIEVTRECFYEALKKAKPGNRVSDISRAVQQHAEKNGYSVVRDYTGHGVGSEMHEPPEVPNFVEIPRKKADPRLMSGMTLAIEPMINEGVAGIYVKDDNWTVVTKDGKNSAHYENTILITEEEPEILTACEDMP